MIQRVQPKRKHHPPVFGKIAWADYVLFQENRNPYRQATIEYDEYEADYQHAEDCLRDGFTNPQKEGERPNVSQELPSL